MGYTYNESLSMAKDILDEAQRTNNSNKDVQRQINDVMSDIKKEGLSVPEVVQARGNFPVLNERLRVFDNKIGNIEINVLDYGAVGDGVTDDTDAFFNALNDLKPGMTFKVPDVNKTYVLRKTSINGKRNCHFIIDGTLKWKDSSNEDAFIVIANSDNAIFTTLKTDGNRANVVNREVNGEQPNISINAGQKGIKFIEPEFYNTVFCGVVFNGGLSNIKFESPYFENVGEHPFYVSGGSNLDVEINNVTVDGFGQNEWYATRQHACSIAKIRKVSRGMNKNIKINGINYKHRESPTTLTVLNVLHVDGLDVNNVVAQEIALSIFSGDTTDSISNVKFDNANVLRPFYSVTMSGALENVEISNSTFGNEVTYIDVFDKLINCTFRDFNIAMPAFSGTMKNKNTKFIECTFKNNISSGRMALTGVKGNIFFNHCIIESNAYSTAEFIHITSINSSERLVVFNECELNTPNYEYSITQGVGINLEIKSTRIDKRMRTLSASNGFLKLDSVTVPSDFLPTPNNPKFIRAYNVTDMNGNDLLKQTKEITLAMGNKLSSWDSLNGFLINPGKYDIQIIPITNTYGLGNYWLNYDNTRFNIHSENAPSSDVKFIANIEVKNRHNK